MNNLVARGQLLMVNEYMLDGFYGTFVVKIWMDHNQTMRRGYIQHVATQEDTHFLSWEKMLAFINCHVDAHSNDMANWGGINSNARPEQSEPTSAVQIPLLETIHLAQGAIN